MTPGIVANFNAVLPLACCAGVWFLTHYPAQLSAGVIQLESEGVMQTAGERARQCVEEFEKEELPLSTSEYNVLCEKIELFLKEQDKLTCHAIAEAIEQLPDNGYHQNMVENSFAYILKNTAHRTAWWTYGRFTAL